MDSQLQFLYSGQAHAFYAIGGIAFLSLAILFGADASLCGVILLLAGGLFVDLWLHQYQH